LSAISVLIVDDSAAMRRFIRATLSEDPRFHVVAEAGSASEARRAINAHDPDVLTLDVEMPQMSGLEFLTQLMQQRPMPVVMVSTLTRRGAEIAVKALSLGAVDCVQKPTGGAFDGLCDALHRASRANVRRHSGGPTQAKTQQSAALPERRTSYRKVCLLGGSTGAVEAFETILSQFGADCPATVITQHMPEQFLPSFAQRLSRRSHAQVRLAREGDPLERGTVLIAPGGPRHVDISKGHRIALVEAPPQAGHRPSVDYMFQSATRFAPSVVAGILTGMGQDGARGLAALRQAGAHTLAQSEATCVVFGMPKVAGNLGGVCDWVDLEDFAEKMLAAARVPSFPPTSPMEHR